MDIIKLWRNELNIQCWFKYFILISFPNKQISNLFLLQREVSVQMCITSWLCSLKLTVNTKVGFKICLKCSFHDKSNMLEFGMHSMCIARCQLGLFCNDRNVYMGVVDAEGITLSAGLAGSSWPGHLALGCDWYSVPRQFLRGPAHRHCPPCTAGSGTCSVGPLSNK